MYTVGFIVHEDEDNYIHLWY